MKTDLFQFNDYKAFLRTYLASPDSERGDAKKLADAAGCQRSYLSSVLNGSAHLTPDHACGICDYLGFSQEKGEYFSLLVDLARSGTPRLRQKIKNQLKAINDEQEKFSKRLDRPSIPTLDANTVYYSSWYWSAAHILVAIPEFQTSRAIAERLRVTEAYAMTVLRSLESLGLVKQVSTRGRWEFASGSVHVANDSPWVALHHQNWRQQAVSHAQQHPLDGMHFTSVTALSESAYRQIRELVLKFVDDFKTVAEPSKSEQLVCMNLDVFRP